MWSGLVCLCPVRVRLRAVDQAADLLSQYEQQEQMERQWASQRESEARQRQLELERARVSTARRLSLSLCAQEDQYSPERTVAVSGGSVQPG